MAKGKKIKKWLKEIYSRIAPWECVPEKINKLYTKMDDSHRKRKKILIQYRCYLIEKRYRCRISPGAHIGSKLFIPHPDGVVIGEKSIIGKNVTIYQQVTIGQNHGKYPVIGDNVIIYAGAKIVGDVHIGDNCIIGANAVVTESIPENSIAGGIPAKVLKKRDLGEKYY